MANVDRGTPWSVTQSAAGSNATATQAGTANAIYYITDVSGSTQGIGTLALLGGSTGSVVLWAVQIGSTAVTASFSFKSPIKGNTGVAVSVIAQGANQSYANMSGFTIYDA